MFSPPQLTVVRCKPECKKTLMDEINIKLENEYSKRFLNVPEILSTNSENIICFKNRIDKEVSPKRSVIYKFLNINPKFKASL